MARISRGNSGLAHSCRETRWSQRCREGVEAQLAIQIAARPRVKFIEAGNSAKNPGGIDGFAQRFELFRQWHVAQVRLFYFGRKFEQVGEQAKEDAELFFERDSTIF